MPDVYPRFRFVAFVALVTLLVALATGNAHAAESVLEADSESILTERSIASRVLGGTDASEGEWPSTVALVRFGNRALADRLFCGGTVVADRWVMTAAHCLFTSAGTIERTSSFRVVGGITDLSTDEIVDEIIVTNIYIHPEYDNDSGLPPNDIALLELATAIDAPVAELFAGDATLYNGSLGFIVGWGATSYENNVGSDLPDRQQEATVPLVSHEMCNQPVSYNGIVSTRQLCAGFVEGGIDTCSGDSGGPLYIVENSRVVQVGITSFGDGCGLENKFGIYTDVSQFISWLGDYISVPSQSAELLALFDAREKGLVGGTERNEVEFLGAFQPLSLLALAMMFAWRCGAQVRLSIGTATKRNARPTMLALTRTRTSTSTSTNTNTVNSRNVRGKMLSLVSAAMLLLTGCSVSTAISGDRLAKTIAEDPAMLTLSEHSGRAGLADIALGQSRSEAMAAIESLPVADDQILCQSKKTGLKGTGRAYFNETCVFEAVMAGDTSVDADSQANPNAFYIASLVVKRITAEFLDEQLVGLQIIAVGESMTPLIEQINAQYAQLEAAGRPFEWQSSGKDAIRLMTSTDADQDDASEVSVELVSADIDGRLPTLFSVKN